MKKFLSISRPRFWLYTAGPFWLSAAILYPLGQYTVPILVMLLYFTFPANILIYGINDIYDRATDALNPKKGEYEELLQSRDTKKLKNIILISNIPFWIYSYFFLPETSSIALALFVLLAWQYSAPPIRAKTKPFFDSFTSAILYIVPVGVSWGIVADSFPPALPLLAGFIWAYAMHVYSAIPDITADTSAGIKTGATYLSKNKTILLCSLLFILSAFIAYTYIGFFAILFCAVYLYLMKISYTKNSGEEVLSVYKLFPIVNSLVGVSLFVISLLLGQGLLF